MSGYQNRKAQDLQKPFPGCIGTMINIFDLSAGMNGTRLLTDKAHRDGSPVRRNKPDIKKATDPSGDYVGDKQIASQTKKNSSSKKSGGTPMKMLIAEEMSKETESKRKQPSLVARLMGLDDDLPTQQPILTVSGRSLREYYPTSTLASFGICQQQDVFSKLMPRELYLHNYEEVEVKDIYEVRQQPSRISISKDQVLEWGTCRDINNEKRMTLVRQKFMEAKRLAADEKLLHSKEFQDAVEVLSSNKDLFLKFLEEPNSLFLNQMKDLHTISPPPQTRRITILKPSKAAETKNEKLVRRQQYPVVDDRRFEPKKRHMNSNYSHLKAEGFSHPTRIVVLKPSASKPFDMKAKLTRTSTSPKVVEHIHASGVVEDGEDLRSNLVAGEKTQQMRETSSCHRRDESLLSSVYSNGYGGDESSFHRSEDEYIEEDGGGFSDSEIVTPTSRHSWDFANRFDSPYSVSSLSRASYSPESSLIREAKKRLSERWALVASNGINQEELQLRRSSSTLGEMLAIPEVKKRERSDGLITSSSKSYGGEDEMRLPTSCLSIGRTKDTEGDKSPKSLSRSKSVPVSSSAYDDIELQVEVCNSQSYKSTIAKEVTKSKKGKLSLKGKISSFFFPRSKKPSGQKLVSSSSVDTDVKNQSSGVESAAIRDDESLKLVHEDLPVQSPINDEENCVDSAPSISVVDAPKNTTLSLEKRRTCDNLNDKDKLRSYQSSNMNQDQPSPTSVLDAPFEDDGNENETQSSGATSRRQQPLSRTSPIESISRTLSWDDDHRDARSSKPLKMVTPSSNDDEHEHFLFIQKLLSSAGLEQPSMIFSGWHSLDSPLEPSLLDKLLDYKEEGAKCREERTNKKLLFDCVNSALLEVGYAALLNACPWTRSSFVVQNDVWAIVKYWLSAARTSVTYEANNSSQVVDRALRWDIGGKDWVESMRLELEEISKEISGEVLKDLVGEALADFTVVCL